MLLWRASGAHSSRSWSTTVITEAGRKQLERSRSISRSSITASAARPGWDSCHPRPMNRDSMLDYQQHERFGVYYLRPTPNWSTPMSTSVSPSVLNFGNIGQDSRSAPQQIVIFNESTIHSVEIFLQPNLGVGSVAFRYDEDEWLDSTSSDGAKHHTLLPGDSYATGLWFEPHGISIGTEPHLELSVQWLSMGGGVGRK